MLKRILDVTGCFIRMSLVMSFFLLSSCNDSNPLICPPVSVGFTTLYKSDICGAPARYNLIIDNDINLSVFNYGHDNCVIGPVDFSKKIMIVVCMGQRYTGCYGTTITSISNNCSKITVKIKEESPADLCGGAAPTMMTDPVHIVLIDKTSVPIEFEYESMAD